MSCSGGGTDVDSRIESETTSGQGKNSEDKIPIKSILQRRDGIENASFYDDAKTLTLIRPLLPYHKRWENYIARRNEIFGESALFACGIAKPKRSTLRLRRYWKLRRICRRFLVSAVITNPSDKRYYAKMGFLQFVELGLLDTGANISCIGAELARYDFSECSGFSKCKAYVKTADGRPQDVIGWLNVEVRYKDLTHDLRFFIVPSISQRVILGVDFCKAFRIFDDVLGSIDMIGFQGLDHCAPTLEEIPSPSASKDHIELTEEDLYPLSRVRRQQLDTVIALFPSFEKQGLGRTDLIRHSIDVGQATPIKQRFYPVSPAVEKVMYKEVDRMLSLGVIEPSQSAWSSPMRLVLKPNKVRLCLDARRVNAVTKKDAYPLPSIEGIFSRLPKAHLISKLDLKDAYWQIALDEESKALTAFTIPGRPLYQFVVMPFGLCNAPQTMCRLMDQLIPNDLRHSVFGYLDDLVIVSENFEGHLEILVRIASQFRKANLTLNISKSKFCVTKANYLGYVIGQGGIATDPEKVSAIQKWPVPKNLKQVRGFLGLAGWYRRFIENFSSVVFPITELLSSKKKFVWTRQADSAFRTVKMLLTTAPVLANPDFSKKFYLHCDASDYGIGAVLVQLDDEQQERPIAYMSRKLNSAQRNYSVTERECLAALEAIRKFRCYIEMQDFEVVTDHSSLVWLMRQPNLSGRLARWALELQTYRFEVSHRKGRDHIVPDALSRIPEGDVSALEITGPEVDLASPHFSDEDYADLKRKVTENSSAYPDVKVVDQFVYIRTEHYTGDKSQEQMSWKLWIPMGLREQVISRAHDSPICSHGGICKTLELIRRHFYWPGMVRDVRKYLNGCEVCKSTKHPNFVMKPPMGNQVIAVRPFQRLYIDLLGPYPRSKSGFIGLLIVLDQLTKFHWLYPLRKFTSSKIQEYLESQIFHVYGVPEEIISDNGSQFKAGEFDAFLTSYGIRHVFTAVYSPQANASERVNRSVIAGIRAYLRQDHRLWDEKLSFISCSLRNSYHQSIGNTPYRALFGMNMVTHGSSYSLLRNLRILDEPCATMNRDDQLQIVRHDIRRKMKLACERNQERYNLRTRVPNFCVGQEVFRRNFAQSNFAKGLNAKLMPVFLKARIREKLGRHYYVLEDLQGKTIGTFHAKDIRP